MADSRRWVAVREQSRTPTAFKVEWHTSLEPLRGAWDELAERSRNIFATWEWTQTWWSHFGRDRPLHVAACRHTDDGLAALLPLHIATTSPIRLVRFVGYGPADQLGPICDRDDRAGTAGAFRAALEDAPFRWDAFFGEQLAAEEGWSTLLGAKVLHRAESPGPPFRRVVGRIPCLSQLELSTVRWPKGAKARSRTRPAIPPYRGHRSAAFCSRHAFLTPCGKMAERLAVRNRGGVPSRIRRSRGATRLASPLVSRCGRGECCRLVRLSICRRRVVLPGWPRPSLGSLLGGARPASARCPRSAQRGSLRVPVRRGAEPFKYRFAEDEEGLETIGLSSGVPGAVAVALAPVFKRWRPRKLVGWYHGERRVPA